MDQTKPTGAGKKRLLDTAERLMAQRTVDAVSLREIVFAAGHRNLSAVHYHFGNRENLVQAVVERRLADIDSERTALLDQLEATGDAGDLRAVLEAFVSPTVAHLGEASGRYYWRLMLQLLYHPEYRDRVTAVLGLSPSIARSAALASATGEFGHLPADILTERVDQFIGLFTRALAEQSRLMDSDAPHRAPLAPEAFKNNLIDALHALLTARVSTVEESN
jgi:AcrR family transcriptional regulator